MEFGNEGKLADWLFVRPTNIKLEVIPSQNRRLGEFMNSGCLHNIFT
jgi:hypothetical protein